MHEGQLATYRSQRRATTAALGGQPTKAARDSRSGSRAVLGAGPPVEVAVECQPLFLEERPENLDQMMGSLEDLATWNCRAATDQVTKTLA